MQGGEEQISARVAYNEIDLGLFFRDPMSNAQYEPDVHAISPTVRYAQHPDRYQLGNG